MIRRRRRAGSHPEALTLTRGPIRRQTLHHQISHRREQKESWKARGVITNEREEGDCCCGSETVKQVVYALLCNTTPVSIPYASRFTSVNRSNANHGLLAITVAM